MTAAVYTMVGHGGGHLACLRHFGRGVLRKLLQNRGALGSANGAQRFCRLSVNQEQRNFEHGQMLMDQNVGRRQACGRRSLA